MKKEELTKLHPPYTVVDCEIGKGSYVSSNSKIVNTSIGKFCSMNSYFYSIAKQNGSSLTIKNLVEERKSIIIGNDISIGR